MRLGISTPVLVQHPGTRSAWEATATIDHVAEIAQCADRLGFHHLTCSEHVAVPVEVAMYPAAGSVRRRPGDDICGGSAQRCRVRADQRASLGLAALAAALALEVLGTLLVFLPEPVMVPDPAQP